MQCSLQRHARTRRLVLCLFCSYSCTRIPNTYLLLTSHHVLRLNILPITPCGPPCDGSHTGRSPLPRRHVTVEQQLPRNLLLFTRCRPDPPRCALPYAPFRGYLCGHTGSQRRPRRRHPGWCGFHPGWWQATKEQPPDLLRQLLPINVDIGQLGVLFQLCDRLLDHYPHSFARIFALGSLILTVPLCYFSWALKQRR